MADLFRTVVPVGEGGGRLHTSMSMQHFNAEPFMMVGQAPPYDRSANRKTVVVNRPKKSGGITIAIHRKPHTVLRCLAVQPRTVFDNAPCLKLSVDGYTIAHNTMILFVGWVRSCLQLKNLPPLQGEARSGRVPCVGCVAA